jgi:cholesterol transport system auxiliary component
MIRPAGCCVLALFAAGCVARVPAPERRTFALETAVAVEARETPLAGTALVRRARVGPRYEATAFVYRRGEFAWESDYYNGFLIAPAAQLTECVRETLASSGLFRHVTAGSSPTAADLEIETVVNSLYGDWSDLDRPRAVLELELFAIDPAGDLPAIRLHRRYRQEVDSGEPTASALAAAWSRALQEALTHWCGELERELEARPAPGTPRDRSPEAE